MSGGLPELLGQAVPEPPDRLDPDVVLRAARRHQSRRRSIAAAVAVAVVAVVAAPLVLLQDGGGGELPVADVPRTLSALEQRVPLGEVALGALGDETPLAHPGQGTLVGVVGDDEVWLVRTADDELCLLSVFESYGSAGVSCDPRAELLDEGVILVTRGVRPDAPLLLAVAVPDGYTTAEAGDTTAEVRRNVALFAFDGQAPPSLLTISGPDRPTVSFPLDQFAPPGTPTPSGRDAGEGAEAAARLLLTELIRRADRYRQEHQTVDGFVASLPAARRDEARSVLADLSDNAARARVNGTCLDADLRTATLHERAC